MDDRTAHENADDHNNGGVRDAHGRFKRGHGGRRRGSRNRATVLAEKLIAGQAEELIEKAVALGLKGNPTVLTALLRCLCPPAKERAMPIRFRLPPLRTADDAMASIGAITEGVARGELDADAAKVLVSLVAEFRQTLCAVDHERRLAEIEARPLGAKK
jgi:hypothetical protein